MVLVTTTLGSMSFLFFRAFVSYPYSQLKARAVNVQNWSELEKYLSDDEFVEVRTHVRGIFELNIHFINFVGPSLCAILASCRVTV